MSYFAARKATSIAVFRVIDSGRRFGVQDAIRRWSDREFIGADGRMTVKGIEHTLELKGRRITITIEEFQDKKWKNKIRDAAS